MFASESELTDLVSRWSDCSLPGPAFTHKAHVAVCSYFAWHNTLPDAYAAMKTGIFRFNEAVGTPNTEDRGYHETLTRFWCMLLFRDIHAGSFRTCLEATNAMIDAYGTNSRLDRSYYSFDVVKSREARASWIAPDLQVLTAAV